MFSFDSKRIHSDAQYLKVKKLIEYTALTKIQYFTIIALSTTHYLLIILRRKKKRIKPD